MGDMMNIDMTKLIALYDEEIIIEDEVLNFSSDLFVNTSIRELKNVVFNGNIEKLCDGSYQISGKITGVMVLPDDITLEDVDYSFESVIEEKFSEFDNSDEKSLEIVKNRLDITEFLWQNILVEIPPKIVSEKNRNLTMRGNGWRLVTEEELKNNDSNDSPFSELYNLIDSRKE